METLANDATDRDLIECADRWATLLETETYAEAFAFTAQDPSRGWSPELIRSVIKSYGGAIETQGVSVDGQPRDITGVLPISRRGKAALELNDMDVADHLCGYRK